VQNAQRCLKVCYLGHRHALSLTTKLRQGIVRWKFNNNNNNNNNNNLIYIKVIVFPVKRISNKTNNKAQDMTGYRATTGAVLITTLD
jgi:hypothetical protein